MSDVGAVEEVVASDACDIPQRIGACLGVPSIHCWTDKHRSTL